MVSKCVFHVRVGDKVTPRSLREETRSIGVLLIDKDKEFEEFFEKNTSSAKSDVNSEDFIEEEIALETSATVKDILESKFVGAKEEDILEDTVGEKVVLKKLENNSALEESVEADEDKY
ncbi:unnamed protein product [Didymodactylos carnosus]|uniref:Uncharacterized protein n=2 Tax=Didymodactylos carnosus TaxID=1234261 RepID=A0A8S2I6E6_9BILA|nr:unnamed protein product [Didymodactylos carnosus]CAF3696475.1 unnamed protein product [Didymodactylos carnosus]